MSDLICTYQNPPPAPPRKCNAVGQEFCIDCLRGTDLTDMSVGLANDCEIEISGRQVHDCPDCSCRRGHEEGFVACGPDHKVAQMMLA